MKQTLHKNILQTEGVVMRELRSNRWFLFNGVMIALLAMTVLGQAADTKKKKSDDEGPISNYGRESRTTMNALNRDPNAPLNDREKIHHVLSRFSFGATPELMKEVEEMGLKKWIDTQIKNDIKENRTFQARLDKLESLKMSNKEIVDEYRPVMPPELSLKNKLTKEDLRERSEILRRRYIPKDQLKDYVLLSAIYGNHQFKEAVSDFWRNHFNVEATKGMAQYYTTTYERDVIRAEALGTFKAMLNKEARHPAMLVYLDNYISRSIPPKSLLATAKKEFGKSRDYEKAMAAADIAKMRGLNENYARELMELHTLGVDNYYTQDDVISVAEALTGWTITRGKDKPITFEFRKDMHTPANRKILKVRMRGNAIYPEAEGQQVLDLLAKHKGTAQFISYKLCRHFVNDNPSRGMVNRVARVFKRRNKTDLKAVYKAIINDKEFYDPRNYQTKFKRPMEFIASAIRVTHADVESTKGLHKVLLNLNEPIYECIDPTGYYDQADVWSDPGTISARWQFGLQLALGKVPGVKVPESFWEGLDLNNATPLKEGLIKKVLPLGVSEQTDKGLDKMIRKYGRDYRKTEHVKYYILGVLLGSPEFQRQ